jgi:hypothetical protein
MNKQQKECRQLNLFTTLFVETNHRLPEKYMRLEKMMPALATTINVNL